MNTTQRKELEKMLENQIDELMNKQFPHSVKRTILGNTKNDKTLVMSENRLRSKLGLTPVSDPFTIAVSSDHHSASNLTIVDKSREKRLTILKKAMEALIAHHVEERSELRRKLKEASTEIRREVIFMDLKNFDLQKFLTNTMKRFKAILNK